MLLEVNAEHPEPRKIERAAQVLRDGKVLGYPTDTVYGLAADPFDKGAVERLYQVRGLKTGHPLAFVCADIASASKLAILDNAHFRLLKHLWPGPYCFLFEATREVPRMLHASKRKTVGIRVPAHPVVQALLEAFGGPIVTTTAAPRGGGDPYVDPAELDEGLPGVELVLDAGPGELVPTTIVDLSTSPPEVVREGKGDVSPFVAGPPSRRR